MQDTPQMAFLFMLLLKKMTDLSTCKTSCSHDWCEESEQ